MYLAASFAIAGLSAENELVPSPIDSQVHLAVAHAVAKAAMETGAAMRRLDEDYFENMDMKTFTL